MRLGAHESIAGALPLALERAAAHGCEALQVFTTSPNRWQAMRRNAREIAEFASLRDRRMPLLVHGSYLVNPAAPDAQHLERSRRALAAELERCEELGVNYLVVHPGAHAGAGVARGLATAASSLVWALRRAGRGVLLLLELTAGQGTVLGASFAELRVLFEALDAEVGPGRVGLCFDTCHALAAGYELRTHAGYQAVFAELDAVVGLGRLRAFHLNDSLGGLRSRLDRHAEIGRGALGEQTFRRLVNDRRFADLPGVLEVPPLAVARNLRRLKALCGRA